MARSLLIIGLLLGLSGGCSSLAGELQTAQSLYGDARYEDALTWLVDLEREADRMGPPELTRFYYLRGMTAFRLGQRDEALHYLSLASVLVADGRERLPDPWRPVMRRTLEEIMPGDASPHAQRAPRPETL